MKKAIALAIGVSIAITAVLRLHPMITACITAAIILVLYHPDSSAMLKHHIAGSSPREKDITLLSDFDAQFEAYRAYNTSAFIEARRSLEAFIELQGVTASHQLYTNARNMKISCLNALHSIIISIDNRQDIDALGDEIANLDKHCERLLSEYRERLEEIPITTIWSPVEDGKIKPYVSSVDALDAYGWFL